MTNFETFVHSVFFCLREELETKQSFSSGKKDSTRDGESSSSSGKDLKKKRDT